MCGWPVANSSVSPINCATFTGVCNFQMYHMFTDVPDILVLRRSHFEFCRVSQLLAKSRNRWLCCGRAGAFLSFKVLNKLDGGTGKIKVKEMFFFVVFNHYFQKVDG